MILTEVYQRRLMQLMITSEKIENIFKHNLFINF